MVERVDQHLTTAIRELPGTLPVDPDAKGAMRPSPALRQHPARRPGNRRLDQLLQPSAPTSGVENENASAGIRLSGLT